MEKISLDILLKDLKDKRVNKWSQNVHFWTTFSFNVLLNVSLFHTSFLLLHKNDSYISIYSPANWKWEPSWIESVPGSFESLLDDTSAGAVLIVKIAYDKIYGACCSIILHKLEVNQKMIYVF